MAEFGFLDLTVKYNPHVGTSPRSAEGATGTTGASKSELGQMLADGKISQKIDSIDTEQIKGPKGTDAYGEESYGGDTFVRTTQSTNSNAQTVDGKDGAANKNAATNPITNAQNANKPNQANNTMNPNAKNNTTGATFMAGKGIGGVGTTENTNGTDNANKANNANDANADGSAKAEDEGLQEIREALGLDENATEDEVKEKLQSMPAEEMIKLGDDVLQKAEELGLISEEELKKKVASENGGDNPDEAQAAMMAGNTDTEN